MKIDWSINVGEMIAAVVLLVGFVTAHTQNVRKLQDIETRLDLIYDWFTHNIINGGQRRDE